MSVAFTKEDSAETASETLLPDRPVSPHPNLVTEAGLKALEFQLHQAREAYETAQKIEDVNDRRRQAATPLRDARYFAARVRTAQVIPHPTSTDTVAFGSTVTFRRGDGRVQKYCIVGEDEADPKAGSISFVSPVARLLMGKAVGDEVGASGQELEIIAISVARAQDAAAICNGGESHIRDRPFIGYHCIRQEQPRVGTAPNAHHATDRLCPCRQDL